MRGARAAEQRVATDAETAREAEEAALREKHRPEALRLLPEIFESVDSLRSLRYTSAENLITQWNRNPSGHRKVMPIVLGRYEWEQKMGADAGDEHGIRFVFSGASLAESCGGVHTVYSKNVIYFCGWSLPARQDSPTVEIPLSGEVVAKEGGQTYPLERYADLGIVKGQGEHVWVGVGKLIAGIPETIAEHILDLEQPAVH